MTREEAYRQLGLSSGADPRAVRRAYEEAAAELSMIAGSAGTEALRQTYAAARQQLDEAYRLLATPPASPARPTVQPAAGPQSQRPQPPQPATRPTPQPARTAPPRPTATRTAGTPSPAPRSPTIAPPSRPTPATPIGMTGLRTTQLADLPAAAPMSTVPPVGLTQAPGMPGAGSRFGTPGRPTPPGSRAGTPAGTPSGDSRRTAAPAAAVAMDLRPGLVLAGRYEVRRRIGAGGMGAVYAAYDANRDEEIAVKVMLPALLTSTSARQRFFEEGRVASSLSHPNIVNVYDVQAAELPIPPTNGSIHRSTRSPQLFFITMELLEGATLRDRMNTIRAFGQRFDAGDVQRVALAVADGLAQAHKTTVHRDVKPENIFLCDDGTVKLMDFGIARVLGPSRMTATGMSTGTAYYMAPEQLRGAADVDGRADQYALAVVLYEMLAGEVPAGRARSLVELRDDVPKYLSDAIDRALETSPEDRFPDMDAFAAAVEGQKTGSRSRSRRRHTAGKPVWRSPLALTGIAAAVAILAAGPWWFEPASRFVRLQMRDETQYAKLEQSRDDAESARGKLVAQMAYLPELQAFEDATEAETLFEQAVAAQDDARDDVAAVLFERARGKWQSAQDDADRAARDREQAVAQLAVVEDQGRRWKRYDKRTESGERPGAAEAAEASEIASRARSEFEQGNYAAAERSASLAERQFEQALTLLDGLYLVDAQNKHRELEDELRGLSKLRDQLEQALADAEAAAKETAAQMADPAVSQAMSGEQWQQRMEQNSRAVAAAELRLELGRRLLMTHLNVGALVESHIRQNRHVSALEAAEEAMAKLTGWRDVYRQIETYADVADRVEASRQWWRRAIERLGKQPPEDDETAAGYWTESRRLLDERNLVGAIEQARLAAAAYRQSDAAKTDGEKKLRELLAGETEWTNELGMSFRILEPGRFVMGSPTEESGRRENEPRRNVELTRPILLSLTEVTQEQFETIMGFNPSQHRGQDLPVDSVSWEDAQEFCRLLGERDGRLYRLPTEAEWEYAARAGTVTPYAGAHDAATLREVGLADFDLTRLGDGAPQAVAMLSPNAWGFYDMHGNVAEWCVDRYDRNGPAGMIDPVQLARGERRVIRGGSWLDAPDDCRSAWRDRLDPEARPAFVGFRVALCFDPLE